MDKAELARSHPDLLAAIQREAAEAALKERDTSEEAAQATASALALMETVCGKETADKVRALMETGVTPEQLRAAAQVLGAPAGQPAKDAEKDARTNMLEAIKQATPAAVNGGSGAPQDETAALIQRIGNM